METNAVTEHLDRSQRGNGLRCAGQIDLLLVHKNSGAHAILDWKRTRSIHENSHGQLDYPLQHLPSSSYWMYALQINIYAYFLKTEYGIFVSKHWLALVHPSLPFPRLIEVPPMDEEVAAIHDFQIECGCAHESQALDTSFKL